MLATWNWKITLYSRSHKQELLTQSFEMEFPKHCTVCYNWHIHVHTHVHTQGPITWSAVDCVQCMQCVRGSWLFRTQYHVAFLRVVIGETCIVPFKKFAIWFSVMSMFITRMLHIHVFGGRCFTVVSLVPVFGMEAPLQRVWERESISEVNCCSPEITRRHRPSAIAVKPFKNATFHGNDLRCLFSALPLCPLAARAHCNDPKKIIKIAGHPYDRCMYC